MSKKGMGERGQQQGTPPPGGKVWWRHLLFLLLLILGVGPSGSSGGAGSGASSIPFVYAAAKEEVRGGHGHNGGGPLYHQGGSNNHLKHIKRGPQTGGSHHNPGPPVLVQPPVLIFKNSPICIPAVAIIDVVNRSPNKELQLLHITAANPQFYPAMFKPQVLQPMGRTSVQVIFLPRTLGSIETTITISTSEGEVSYPIQAQPTQNVYRLNPIVGSKVPAGVPNIRPIMLYNPHSHPLHVLEVFTTESFLNIIIPDSDDSGSDQGRSFNYHGINGPQTMGVWAIPPKAEKEIVKLSFRGTRPGKYSGYVHIKTDLENIVLPIELNVVKGGVYPDPKEVDFGILTRPDETRRIPISLLNSASTPIAVLDVNPSLPDSLLKIEFEKNQVIPAGVEKAEGITLAYSGRTPGKVSGKVIIITNHTNSGLATVEVGYTANVLHGGVGYIRKDLTFFVGKEDGKGRKPNHRVKGRDITMEEARRAGHVMRTVQVTNKFSIPLSLQNVGMKDCQNAMEVVEYTRDAVAHGNQKWPPVTVKFFPEVALQYYDLPKVCSLALSTNATQHVIPVYVYNGRLRAHGQDEISRSICFMGPPERSSPLIMEAMGPNYQYLTVDMGIMMMNQTKSTTIYLNNHNPLPVTITGVHPETERDRLQLSMSGQYISEHVPQPVKDIFSHMMLHRDERRSKTKSKKTNRSSSSSSSSSSRDKPLTSETLAAGALNTMTISRPLPPDPDSPPGSRVKKRPGGRSYPNMGKVPVVLWKKTTALDLLMIGMDWEQPVTWRLKFRQKASPLAWLKRKEREVESAYDDEDNSDSDIEDSDEEEEYEDEEPSSLEELLARLDWEAHLRTVKAQENKAKAEGADTLKKAEIREVVEKVTNRELTKKWVVDPGQTANVTLSLRTPTKLKEGQRLNLRVEGLVLKTPVEEIAVNVRVRVAHGTVRFDVGEMDLGACLAGSMAHNHIFVTNTMAEPIQLLSLRSSSRFFSTAVFATHIPANTTRYHVGVVLCDPNNVCQGVWSCVSQWIQYRLKEEPKLRPEDQEFLIKQMSEFSVAGVAAPTQLISPIDVETYDRLQSAWSEIVARRLNYISTELTLETPVRKGTTMRVKAELVVPYLVSHGPRPLPGPASVGFPMSHVGQVMGRYIPIFNPLLFPLQVQLVVACDDNGTAVMTTAVDSSSPKEWWGVRLKAMDRYATSNEGSSNTCNNVPANTFNPVPPDEEAFTFVDPASGEFHTAEVDDADGLCPFGPDPVDDASDCIYYNVLPFRIDPSAMTPVALPPRSKALLGPVLFRPALAGNYSLFVYVWNNLTGLERVPIHAQAGRGNLRLESGEGTYLGGTDLFTLPCEDDDETFGEGAFREENAPVVPEGLVHFPVGAGAGVVTPLPTKEPQPQSADKMPELLASSTQSIRLINDGDLPLKVLGVDIGGERCGGSRTGFSVDDCRSEPFLVPPQASRALNIRYATSCMVSREQHTLVVHTSVGSGKALLIADVATDVLRECEKLGVLLSNSYSWEGAKSAIVILALLVALISTRDALGRAWRMRKASSPTIEEQVASSGQAVSKAHKHGMKSPLPGWKGPGEAELELSIDTEDDGNRSYVPSPATSTSVASAASSSDGLEFFPRSNSVEDALLGAAGEPLGEGSAKAMSVSPAVGMERDKRERGRHEPASSHHHSAVHHHHSNPKPVPVVKPTPAGAGRKGAGSRRAAKQDASAAASTALSPRPQQSAWSVASPQPVASNTRRAPAGSSSSMKEETPSFHLLSHSKTSAPVRLKDPQRLVNKSALLNSFYPQGSDHSPSTNKQPVSYAHVVQEGRQGSGLTRETSEDRLFNFSSRSGASSSPLMDFHSPRLTPSSSLTDSFLPLPLSPAASLLSPRHSRFSPGWDLPSSSNTLTSDPWATAPARSSSPPPYSMDVASTDLNVAAMIASLVDEDDLEDDSDALAPPPASSTTAAPGARWSSTAAPSQGPVGPAVSPYSFSSSPFSTTGSLFSGSLFFPPHQSSDNTTTSGTSYYAPMDESCRTSTASDHRRLFSDNSRRPSLPPPPGLSLPTSNEDSIGGVSGLDGFFASPRQDDRSGGDFFSSNSFFGIDYT